MISAHCPANLARWAQARSAFLPALAASLRAIIPLACSSGAFSGAGAGDSNGEQWAYGRRHIDPSDYRIGQRR